MEPDSDESRAQFEAAMRLASWWQPTNPACSFDRFGCGDDEYASTFIAGAWEGWKMRAALGNGAPRT